MKTQTQAVVLATATSIVPPRFEPREIAPAGVVRVTRARRTPLDLDAEVYVYERLPDGRIIPGAALPQRRRSCDPLREGRGRRATAPPPDPSSCSSRR